MKQPQIRLAFGAALVLHISLLLIVLVIAALSPVRHAATNYVVTLVAPPGGGVISAAPAVAPEASPAKPETPVQKKAEPAPVPSRTKQDRRQDEQLLSDRVAAAKAKRRVDSEVAQRRMAEVSASKQPAKASTSSSQQGSGKPGGGDYVSLVTSKIRKNWIYPDSNIQNLEMTVLLRIRKDGSASVPQIIKGSGNALFDRSVLRAINKSMPFPPPPQEQEIEARFSP
ncbi:MAG TPA: TonB family protein [Dissulfurispiraceae bacterium]|nr:TonB family protein [Dissulfurispiraceae bacterium]